MVITGKEKLIIFLGVLVLLVLFSYRHYTNSAPLAPENIAAVSDYVSQLPEVMEGARYQLFVGDVPFDVTVAADRRSRIWGLSGVKYLAPEEGKLFVFEEEGVYGFWMPNMYISLDILWFASDGTLVHIEEQVSPDTYPEQFTSDVPARYVLEIGSGMAEAMGLEEGRQMSFSPALQVCIRNGCY